MKAAVHRTGILVTAVMLLAWSACANGAPTVVGIEGASSAGVRVGRGETWSAVRTSTTIGADQFLRIPQGTTVSVRLPNGEVAKLEGKAVIPGRRLAQKAARADAVMRFARAVRTVSVAIGGEETGQSGPGATKIEALPSGATKDMGESEVSSPRTESEAAPAAAAPASPPPPPPAPPEPSAHEFAPRKDAKESDSAGLAAVDEPPGGGAGAGAPAGNRTRTQGAAMEERVSGEKIAHGSMPKAEAFTSPAAPPPSGVRDGWTAAEEGRFSDALARFRQAPHDPEALVGIGFVHLQRGEPQEAGDAFRKAILAAGESAVPAARRAHFYLGLMAWEEGDEAAANRHFAAASADPALAEAIRTLTGRDASGTP